MPVYIPAEASKKIIAYVIDTIQTALLLILYKRLGCPEDLGPPFI